MDISNTPQAVNRTSKYIKKNKGRSANYTWYDIYNYTWYNIYNYTLYIATRVSQPYPPYYCFCFLQQEGIPGDCCQKWHQHRRIESMNECKDTLAKPIQISQMQSTWMDSWEPINNCNALEWFSPKSLVVTVLSTNLSYVVKHLCLCLHFHYTT